MRKRSDSFESPEKWGSLREQLIGLGESSIRKSYYPELQKRLAELQKFRALLDQSNDAIFVLEVPSGRFTDANESACRQLACSREELLNKSLYDFTTPPAVDRIRQFLLEGQNRVDERETITANLITRNGGEIPSEITFSLVIFDGALCAVAVARDITERKQAEDALRKAHDDLEQKVRERTAELTEAYETLEKAYHEMKANQDKIIQLERRAIATKVTSTLAHETRNPILVIGGFTRLLKRRCVDDPECLDRFDIVLNETKKLEQLVEAILKAGHEIAADFHELDPHQLAEALYEATRDKAHIAKIVIRKEMEPIRAHVVADRECIIMALKEIILNAIEASPQNSEIVITIAQEGQWVVFSISDHGHGINKEHQNKIYGPFFSTKKLSSGLGLSFAKEIIESHNGYISFETKAGQGTTFYVYLPITR